jgi:anti-anti-sigma regulatory factor
MKLTLMPLGEDNLIRVRCEGRLLSPRGHGGDPLESLLGPQCHAHKVLLNFGEAEGVDTAGVSWLLQTDREFRRAGGRFVLCGVPPLALDLMRVLRLESALCIARGEQEARALAEATDGDPPPKLAELVSAGANGAAQWAARTA